MLGLVLLHERNESFRLRDQLERKRQPPTQRAAAKALAKLTELNEVIGMRSEIARGIDAAMGADCNISKISPADVIQAINRRTAEIEEAFAEAKADKLAHNSVNKTCRDRLAPLNAAVNKVAASLTAERDALIVKSTLTR